MARFLDRLSEPRTQRRLAALAAVLVLLAAVAIVVVVVMLGDRTQENAADLKRTDKTAKDAKVETDKAEEGLREVVKVIVEKKVAVIGPNGLQGATGPIGKTGPRGPVGLVGRRGDIGAAGETGERGTPGTDGRNGVDGKDGRDAPPPSQDQVNASIAAYCAVNTCIGPAGPQGPAGADGAPGPAGPQGPPGVTCTAPGVPAGCP